jgi:hypothetical protein
MLDDTLARGELHTAGRGLLMVINARVVFEVRILPGPSEKPS